MKITHIYKCLDILSRTKQWLHAWSFNEYEDVFIGHRGCARISDTAKLYPYMVETQKDKNKPRMHVYRLKWESLGQAMETLHERDLEAYKYLKTLLLARDTKWQEMIEVPEYMSDNSVRLAKKLVTVDNSK